MMSRPAQTHAWSLAALLEGFVIGRPLDDVAIGELTLDSRRVEPGALFVACRGTRSHGLEHAAQARERGAAAIVAEPDERWSSLEIERLARELRVPIVPVEGLAGRASALAARFYHDPSAHLSVIGVTGTNGKTSVTHFIAQALGHDCGLIGTLGSGFPGDLVAGDHTTPDPLDLQRTLAWLLRRGARSAAIEVSSHALDQGRAAAVRFEQAVYTNLGRDHLDYHGDIEAYAAAKRRLFTAPGLGWAILNADEPEADRIRTLLDPAVAVALYSARREGPAGRAGAAIWVCAERIETRPGGLAIDIATSEGSGELVVDLIGRFNVHNLLAVMAELLARGQSFDAALAALARIRGVPGRMERFGGGRLPVVVVDYAHTADALEQALSSARDHTRGRLHLVFGCGGERDTGKRALMGAVAERLADQVIVTDDNPRHEDGDRIVADILAGMVEPGRAEIERNRALAIRRAIALADNDDLVLVAGKGHETTQAVGDLTIAYSDRAQVLQALGERGAGT